MATLYLADEDEVIRKKVMKTKTDAGPTEINSSKPDYIENIFGLMKLVSSDDVISKFEGEYNNCIIRYGDMKKQLAEDMITFTSPFHEKITELSKDESFIHRVATRGAEKARESASKTVSEARHAIGIRHF